MKTKEQLDEEELAQQDDQDDEDKQYKLTEDTKIKIYADKETVTNAATASNDFHNNVIDEIEDAIKQSLDAEMNEIISSVKGAETLRNRSRLAEVTKFYECQKQDVVNVVIL